MKVICFANNTVGLEVVKHLGNSDVTLVALVVHEEDQQKLTDRIVAASGLESEKIFTGNQIKSPDIRKQLAALKPDCGVSAFFGHIIGKSVIDIFPRGIVNLHTSLLPLNRGSWPNVWTIVDKTPAGVTMHLVDEGVDTGPILAQCPVETLPTDNGRTLNERLESAVVKLFQDNWDDFAKGKLDALPQQGPTTTHKVKDADTIDEIKLDQQYLAGDLINILRARTFPPHRGAWFKIDGRKYFLKLDIDEE